ncbi:quercetin dioxygenase-like cupin family protein [Lentzea atacamensis]|uniref:Quercetin dioxygenase-like cupin family protein n=1 Tax=Lentzea atacamensis TaxID=531938 RepID=A0A316I3M0_9PSEU|nr:cupin domain-containing protein [Lentzea atacamensis]PWK85043.1 quercetin dioxygenase-like cupin family protein [Lentzea atacamensis]
MSELLHHPPAAGGPPPKVEILAESPGVAPVPESLVARSILVTLPPGSPGAPPHRHPGPVYAHVVKGAITFELEGAPERVIRAGEAFFEPGGDVIHYKGANHLDDEESALIATMICEPGAPALTLVGDEELAARKHLRAPR